MEVDLVTIVVRDYDEAIAFFVDRLDFVLVADSPATTSHGDRPKRWVVVRPPDGGTGLLLARADGPEQEAARGAQTRGRVSFFLRVDDVDTTVRRWGGRGVQFLEEPRNEPYGRVVTFADVSGNRWDLIGPSA